MNQTNNIRPWLDFNIVHVTQSWMQPLREVFQSSWSTVVRWIHTGIVQYWLVCFLLPFWRVDIVEYLIRGINQMVDVSGERRKQFRKQGQIVSLKNWNRIFQKTKLIDLCLWVSKTYFSTEFAPVIYTKSGKSTCTWVFQIKPLTRHDASKMRSCMKSQALDLFIFSDNLTSPHKHHYGGIFKRENTCVYF